MPNIAFSRQGMAELPGQHRDLAAVVGIVGNQIAEKTRDVGAKSLPAHRRPGHRKGPRSERDGCFLVRVRLARSHRRAIELRKNFFRLGRLRPQATHVVHMGHDGPNGTALAFGRFRFPGCGWKVVDQILMLKALSRETGISRK